MIVNAEPDNINSDNNNSNSDTLTQILLVHHKTLTTRLITKVMRIHPELKSDFSQLKYCFMLFLS